MNGPGRLPAAALEALDTALAPLDLWAARRWPGGSGADQPAHTVYVPADRAEPGVCGRWGREALAALDEHAPGPVSLATATGLPVAEVDDAWPLLRATLERRPIEDLRLDLEDGYGPRPDDVEDADADAAVATLLAEAVAGDGPRRSGVRHRSLEAATRARAVRTLDRVIGGLAAAGGPPEGFVLTLPKVVHVDQVAAYAALLRVLEVAHDLPEDALVFEIQVETPQAILAADGRLPLAPMIDVAGGRCVGLHYGTYDYSAALGVPAAEQRADHPVAQTAKAVMRLAAAGTGVEVSDGSTNRLPVGDRATVHAHWRVHAELVLGALADGVRQGWDLHPAQLVTRHLVTIVAMRRALPGAIERLGPASTRSWSSRSATSKTKGSRTSRPAGSTPTAR
ncbi:aldolase, partial [Patulibacter sp. NPDC049589]|uniref:DUF6986 family protein n=1 Tax=Patulibacter sp. NPDC049589 TaxID=3154731 RepID=UPI0034307241